MLSNNKYVRLIREFIRNKIILEVLEKRYKSIDFIRSIQELSEEKTSLQRDKIVQAIREFDLSQKKQIKKNMKLINKSLRKETQTSDYGLGHENLTNLYLELILDYLKTHGDVSLTESLRVAIEFDKELKEKLKKEIQERIRNKKIRFANIKKIFYLYENKIKPITKGDYLHVKDVDQLKEIDEVEGTKIVVIEEPDYIVFHPKTSGQFKGVLEFCLKDLGVPKYKTTTWCTQRRASWLSHKMEENILIYYNKKLFFNEEASKIETPSDDPYEVDSYSEGEAKLNKYSLISLKIDVDTKKIKYESSVDIDNLHTITRENFSKVVNNIEKIENILFEDSESAVYPDSNISELISYENLFETFSFLSKNNQIETGFKFILNTFLLSSETPLEKFQEVIDYALDFSDDYLDNLGDDIDEYIDDENYEEILSDKQIKEYKYLTSRQSKENFFKMVAESLARILTNEFLRSISLSELTKIFSGFCKKTNVGNEFRSFALKYYMERTKTSNVPFYPMAILMYYGSHSDAKSSSSITPSGLSVEIIKGFYDKIIDGLDSAENPEFMEFYLDNYDLLSLSSYLKHNFIFINNPSVHNKILNSNKFKKLFHRNLGNDMNSYGKIFEKYGALIYLCRKNLDVLFENAPMSKDEFFSKLQDKSTNIYKMSENGIVKCFKAKSNIFGSVDATLTLEEIINENS